MRFSQHIDEFHRQTRPRLMRGKKQISREQDRWHERPDRDAGTGEVLRDNRMSQRHAHAAANHLAADCRVLRFNREHPLDSLAFEYLIHLRARAVAVTQGYESLALKILGLERCFFRQPMPRSDAYRQGLRLGEMLKDIGLLGALVVCGLLVLFLRDALSLPGYLANTLGVLSLVAVGLATMSSTLASLTRSRTNPL